MKQNNHTALAMQQNVVYGIMEQIGEIAIRRNAIRKNATQQYLAQKHPMQIRRNKNTTQQHTKW